MLGWGSLVVAAGVSFYYAKKTINERRAVQESMGQRPSEKLDWRSRIEQQEKQTAAAQSSTSAPFPRPVAAGPAECLHSRKPRTRRERNGTQFVERSFDQEGKCIKRRSMKTRRWTLLKMSASGTLTGHGVDVDLPGTRDPTGYMRPITRSQTRSRPSLKRKGPSEDRMKAARPVKLARTSSTSSDASSKPKREPIIGIPTDVPRSMLSTFRVDPSPFQMYDGERRTTVDAVSRSSSPPRFPATASQPMFGHSWQVPQPDSSHTADYEQSLQVPICASPKHTVHPAVVPPPASAPFARDVGPILRTVRRVHDHADENRSPAGMAMEVPPEEYASLLKTPDVGDDRPIAPLCPSTVSSPNRPSVIIAPIALPGMSAHASGTSTSFLPPSSSRTVENDDEEVMIVQPAPSYSLPGQTPPYASHQTLPLHPGYMQYGAPSPVYSPFGPHLSLTPPDASYPTELPTRNDVPPYPPYPPTYSACYLHPQAPTSFAVAQPFGSHHPSLHLQGLAPSAPVPHKQGFPGFMPSQPPVDTTAPWRAVFDSLKGSNKRLGGASKQKKQRKAASPPTGAIESTMALTLPLQERVPGGPAAEVYPCPLCPRTFTLPNSLAIHLKWHWGASGLDWKKGINLQGKGLQRAFQDAAKRREEVDKLQLDLEQAFADELASTSSAKEEGISPSLPLEEPEVSFNPAYAFDMPVIAQTSVSSIFDFAFGGVDPAMLEDGPETLASSSQMSHTSSSSSPMLPSSSVAASISGSGPSACGSVPLTPEFTDSESASSNAASVGYGSSTWTYDLFGGEADSIDADAGIDGELGVDLNLFGDGFDLDGNNARLDISSGIVGFDMGGDGASPSVYQAEGWSLNSVGRRRVSDHYAAFVSSVSPRLRSGFYRPQSVSDVPCAPRLGPLRLPPGLLDEEEEDEDDQNGGNGQDEYDDEGTHWRREIGPALLHCTSTTTLAPLDDFGSLQALPDLDAFGRLSLF
ncbi:hypothetical protein L226DRAFT_560122 [Lentinus tigrinus ALCF2SS1-7]|uniref:uncharacterized protein n=1 Tax=Lentinus tigrinus ALCF2SS1-7 TaxID=1328758 RepID=UPI0011663715|nr:hypothetical protein L226DRAFT_560122 [Lentinus tigrinus ALCF2SS1-7]